MAVTFKIPIDNEAKDTERFQSNVYFYSKNNQLSSNIDVVLDVDKYRKKALDIMKKNPGISYDVAFNCSKYGLDVSEIKENAPKTLEEEVKFNIKEIKKPIEEIEKPIEEIKKPDKEKTISKEEIEKMKKDVLSDDYFNDFSYFQDFNNLTTPNDSPKKEDNYIPVEIPSLESLYPGFDLFSDTTEFKKSLDDDSVISLNTIKGIMVDKDIKKEEKVEEEISNPFLKGINEALPEEKEIKEETPKEELNNPLLELLDKSKETINNPLIFMLDSTQVVDTKDNIDDLKDDQKNDVDSINSFLDCLNNENINESSKNDKNLLFGFEDEKQKIKTLAA